MRIVPFVPFTTLPPDLSSGVVFVWFLGGGVGPVPYPCSVLWPDSSKNKQASGLAGHERDDFFVKRKTVQGTTSCGVSIYFLKTTGTKDWMDWLRRSLSIYKNQGMGPATRVLTLNKGGM